MAGKKLVWDAEGERLFETGVNQAALYVFDTESKKYGTGVAWNGVSSISESPSGAEATAIYADNTKYLNMYSAEELGATIEAYMYPDEFAECDGSAEVSPGVYVGQQNRKAFGLAYKTLIGSDTEGNDHGYKLHLIYGCKASPSEKGYQTVNDSPEAISFSWTITTTPVGFGTENKKTANLVIDSTKVGDTPEKCKAIMKAIEDKLYGTETEDPTLLLPDEIVELIKTVPQG